MRRGKKMKTPKNSIENDLSEYYSRFFVTTTCFWGVPKGKYFFISQYYIRKILSVPYS